jgi:hypothetical protein
MKLAELIRRIFDRDDDKPVGRPQPPIEGDREIEELIAAGIAANKFPPH